MASLGRLVGSMAMMRSAASAPASRVMMARATPSLVRFMSSAPTPEDRKYADTHEWLKPEGETITVGITTHAADALGDIVYVSLPERGDMVDKELQMGVIESVKAASDLVCPASGQIVDINEALNDNPGLVNSDPYGEGWFVKMKLTEASDYDAMMDAPAYDKFCESESS